MKKIILFLLCSLTFSLSAGEMLSLSSVSGQEISAELIEVSKGVAVLKTSSGAIKKIPIKKFSPESIALLKAEYEKLKNAPAAEEAADDAEHGEGNKKAAPAGKTKVDGLLAEPFKLTHTEVVPKGANFAAASFVLYSDIELEKVRSIFVICPALNGSAENLLADKKWREAAKKLNAAIFIPVYINQDLENMYTNMKKQSGEAFDKALKQVAIKSKFSALNQLPFIVWGGKAGGELAHGILSLYPEKILALAAFFESKPRLETTSKKTKDIPTVPCLFITDNTAASYPEVLLDYYKKYKGKKAPWALAKTYTSHSMPTAAENLALQYFEAIAPLRRPKMGTKLNNVTMLKDTWSGDNESFEIQQRPADKGVSWLPSEAFANAWKATNIKAAAAAH